MVNVSEALLYPIRRITTNFPGRFQRSRNAPLHGQADLSFFPNLHSPQSVLQPVWKSRQVFSCCTDRGTLKTSKWKKSTHVNLPCCTGCSWEIPGGEAAGAPEEIRHRFVQESASGPGCSDRCGCCSAHGGDAHHAPTVDRQQIITPPKKRSQLQSDRRETSQLLKKICDQTGSVSVSWTRQRHWHQFDVAPPSFRFGTRQYHRRIMWLLESWLQNRPNSNPD